VLLKWYLRAAVFVFVLSFLAQTFRPRETAAASVRGFAPGWQREIGFLDLAMALIAVFAIRSSDLRFQRGLTVAIVILTTLVGTNHLFTILSGRTSYLHEVFTGVNYAAVAFGSVALFLERLEPH